MIFNKAYEELKKEKKLKEKITMQILFDRMIEIRSWYDLIERVYDE